MSLCVALAHCAEYAPETVRQAVNTCLETIGANFARGARVLVKPNLLKATPDGLVCTHPQVTRAACEYVLEQGARPFVADSPGFGSGGKVARRIGLENALKDLDAPIEELDAPVRRKLPMGYGVGLSRKALEADAILNLPKLKAHGQMRVTAAVKNLFGCVPGTRKAVAHTRHGDQNSPHGPRFESLIIELGQLLPPTISLVDGVTAMHVIGPTGGRPFPLGLLGASNGTVALDTALYTVLGLRPEDVPLWRECQRRKLAGARLEDLEFPLAAPEDFNVSGFELPRELEPMTFHPVRLGISALKRAWARVS